MNAINQSHTRTGSLLLWLLLLALPVLPCFYHLGEMPLRVWDESRQAHNAYEMYKSHHYMVPTYEGTTDTFGTKPLLFIWAEVLCMKGMGVNEFALRFPAALSAYLLIVLVMAQVWKQMQQYSLALIAGILLSCSAALIRLHVARTADYDAPLAFFLALACFSFYNYITTLRPFSIYLTGIGIALAVGVKGIAGLVFCPLFIAFALLYPNRKQVLRSLHTWLALLLFLMLALGSYLIREMYQPGYMALVYWAEWQTIYFKTVQGHEEPFFFYILNFHTRFFANYAWLFPLGVISMFFLKNKEVKRWLLYATVCTVYYLLIISLSATKLPWYDAPLYATAAVVCCGFFYLLGEKLSQRNWTPAKLNILFLAVLVFLFSLEMKRMKSELINGDEAPGEKAFYSMATYLQQTCRHQGSLNGYKVLSGNAYSPHHTFYIRLLQERGQRVEHAVFDSLQAGDSVLVFEQNMKELLWNKFETTVLDSNNAIFAVRLEALRKP